MKMLIIGIDGGDPKIFRRFDMPFLQNLSEQGTYIPVTQHPLERGWASMLTGKRPVETLGLFMKPVMNSRPELTFKYTLADMLDNPNVKPLWRMAEEKGYRVGFMNVPTTFPAPNVDGFFVSGAGGGLNKVEGIPEAMCYPPELKKTLEDKSYIVD